MSHLNAPKRNSEAKSDVPDSFAALGSTFAGSGRNSPRAILIGLRWGSGMPSLRKGACMKHKRQLASMVIKGAGLAVMLVAAAPQRMRGKK
jgi:hypothetical protein